MFTHKVGNCETIRHFSIENRATRPSLPRTLRFAETSFCCGCPEGSHRCVHAVPVGNSFEVARVGRKADATSIGRWGSLRPVSVGRWVAARSVAVQTEPHVNWRGAAVVPRHVPLATVADAFDAEVPVSGGKRRSEDPKTHRWSESHRC